MNIILFSGEPFFPRSDERYRHIKKVLRKGEGDEFRAGLENGSEGTARITAMDDDGLSFDFVPDTPMRPLFPVSLLIGFPRPIQLKRLLRDAASLGCRSVTLCGTELGERSYLESSLSELDTARQSLVEGCVQAGGTAIPELTMYGSVREALAALGAMGTDGARGAGSGIALGGKLAGSGERGVETSPGAGNAGGSLHAGGPGSLSAETAAWGDRVLLDVDPPDAPSLFMIPLADISMDRPLLLAIGSERGWTANERKLFREAGFKVASLGSRILRTETAATAALALALAKTGYLERLK